MFPGAPPAHNIKVIFEMPRSNFSRLMVRALTTVAESSPSVTEVAISLVNDLIPYMAVNSNVVSTTERKTEEEAQKEDSPFV